MNREQAVNWLKLLGINAPQHQHRTGWTLSHCPLGPWKHDNGHSAPERFGIKDEPGDSFCHCHSCGFHGSQSDLILLMRDLNKKVFVQKFPFGEALSRVNDAEQNAELSGLDSPSIEEMMYAPQDEMIEYASWWFDSFPVVSKCDWAMEYLATRNVSPQMAWAFDLRADSDEKRICFPIRDFKGVLRGLHGRAVDEGTDPRYRMYQYKKKTNPIVWLGEQWVDQTKPIVVVEGPFDLLSVSRVYNNVVSPLFANPSVHKLKRMSDALEIITFLDRGKGGDVGRKKFDTLKGNMITHVKPPTHRKDPGVCSIEELCEILSPHVKVQINSLA